MVKRVILSNLSKANENRNSKIFEKFVYYLIDIAQNKLKNDNFEIKGKVYAFDSSTIDLCLNGFWWVKFRKAKGGIKLHTLYDVTTQIPTFIHITATTVNDVNAIDYIPYESDAYYIFDCGYVDYVVSARKLPFFKSLIRTCQRQGFRSVGNKGVY